MGDGFKRPAADLGRWYHAADPDSPYWREATGTTRDACIAEGRRDYGRDAFVIAYGTAKGAHQDLFDTDGLSDQINTAHEDHVFEDAFLTEAGITPDAIESLAGELNAVWRRWVAKHNPRSSSVAFTIAEAIPALAPEEAAS